MFPSFSKEALDIKVEVDESALTPTASSQLQSLVGAIDQGTSSTRFLVFTPRGTIAAWAQMEHSQIFPEGEDKVTIFVMFANACECPLSGCLQW